MTHFLVGMARTKVQSSKNGKVRHTSLVTGPRFSRAQVNQKAAHVCAICEDGGEIAICDGPCLRQFHLNSDSLGAQENHCPGVDLPSDHEGKWKCPDCVQKQAKCAQCGKLGNFEGSGNAPPHMKKCPDPFCGRFFVVLVCPQSHLRAHFIIVSDVASRMPSTGGILFFASVVLQLGALIVFTEPSTRVIARNGKYIIRLHMEFRGGCSIATVMTFTQSWRFQ